jgi:outer membrane receptor protein involved in Fe transport
MPAGEFAALAHAFDCALFDEREGLKLRIAGYYVGRNLFGVGGNAAQDVYAEARTLLDVGASYAIDRQLGVYLNVKNLTNEPLKYSEGTSDRLVQREFYGVTFQTGLNFNY